MSDRTNSLKNQHSNAAAACPAADGADCGMEEAYDRGHLKDPTSTDRYVQPYHRPSTPRSY